MDATRLTPAAAALLGYTILLSAPLRAQVSDYGLVNPSIAHRPKDLAAADLDQDGRVDVLTCSSPDGRVVVYSNLGQGLFEPGVELARYATTVNDVATGDFDGDGIVDVVVAAGSLEYLRGLGGGQFAAPVVIAPGLVWVTGLRAVDLEGDLDVDLVAVSFDADVDVLENLGSAVFAPPQRVYAAAFDWTIRDVDVRDLDGDGRGDLAAITEDYGYPMDTGELVVILQLPGGGFAPPQTIQLPAYMPTAVVAVDVDDDGLPDVLWGDRFSGELRWHRNLGAGQFTATGTLLATMRSIARLLALDLDADTDEDLLFTRNGAYSWQERIVGELVNLGGGVFTPGQIIDDTLYDPDLLTTADLDQDGTLDVLVATRAESVLWYPRLGAGYGAGAELTELVSYEGVVLSDVDGDGRVDVVSVWDSVRWFRQREDGTFERAREAPFDGISLDAHEMRDLDGDGDADLALVSWTASDELFWLSAGPTGLGAPRTIETFAPGMNFQSPYAADCDGDGDVDLFSAASGTGEVSWFENTGGATFASRVDIDTLDTPFPCPPVDLDGDGLCELVVVSDVGAAGDGLYVYANLGSGVFGGRQLVGTEPGPTLQVLPMDLDADGDQDLLRLDDLDPGGVVQWYENLGGLAFGAAQVVRQSQFGEYYQLRAHDWDLDGREDLMVMDGVLRQVDWSRNEGQGVLAAPVVLASGMRACTLLRVGDLDRDLDPDLVVLDSQMFGIRTYTNLRTLGTAYCASTVNSSGEVARLAVTGSETGAVNRLLLEASSLPPGVFGYFLTSLTQDQVPQPGGSQGILCLGGAIGRFSRPGEIQVSDPAGRMRLEIDLTLVPTPTGTTSVVAGQTWSYQGWFRDVNPTPTSNFTEGVAILYQ